MTLIRTPFAKSRNSRVIISILFAIGVSLSGCGGSPSISDKQQIYLGDAQQEANIQNTARAQHYVDLAIKLNPKDKSLYYDDSPNPDPESLNIAGIFTDANDDPSLVKYMTIAVSYFPTAVTPRMMLMNSEDRLGDRAAEHADALALIALLEPQTHVPAMSENSTNFQDLGQAYFAIGNMSAGKKSMEQAILVASHDAKPDAENGLAYYIAVENMKSSLPEAAQLVKQALYSVRGADLGSQDAITKALKQVTISGPGPDPATVAAEYYDTQAWVQYRQANYSQAMTSSFNALNGLPRVPEIHYHMAMIYLAVNDVPDATSELRNALAINPTYAAAKQALQKMPSPGKPVATSK